MDVVSSNLNEDFLETPTIDGENDQQKDETPLEWNKCIELLDRKKETDEKISQQVTLVANLGKAFDEGVQQNEEIEQNEEKDGIVNGDPQPDDELEQDTNRKHSLIDQHQQSQPQNSNATRARRSKRLYSPSPPLPGIGELGRKKKKEKASDEVASPSVSSQTLQNVGAPLSSQLKWAKAPPSSSSLSSSLDSNEISTAIHDHWMPKENPNKKAKDKLSPSQLTANALAKMETDQSAKSPGNEQSNIQLIRQNEKLTRENVQLKQRNQEQQQQIQALIGANRELIWAFNESRREHDELMQQLRVMAKLVNGKSHEQKANNVRTKQMGKKNAVAGSGGRQRKKQCPGMVYVAQEQMPPTVAILKKTKLEPPQQISAASSEESDRQSTIVFDHQMPAPDEQLRNRIKEEIAQAIERRHNTTSLRRDEEVNKIKDSLTKMAPDSNLNKLIGTRKPVFYTPKEFGDWRSVISSISRKHFVLQLFMALCPEFTGTNVVDLAVKNPTRADFIQKSLNFVFDAENDLFINSNSRDSYFFGLAEKIYTLREAKERQNMDKHSHNGAPEKIGDSLRRRTLADVLKPKRSTATTDEGDALVDGVGAEI